MSREPIDHTIVGPHAKRGATGDPFEEPPVTGGMSRHRRLREVRGEDEGAKQPAQVVAEFGFHALDDKSYFPDSSIGNFRLSSNSEVSDKSDMTLKDKVAQRLAELKLGPIEAATAADLERNFIADILIGRKQSPRADNMQKLARALQTTVGWLMDETPTEPSIVPIEEAERNGGNKPHLAPVSTARDYRGSSPGAMAELDARAGAGNGDPGRVVSIYGKGIETGHLVRAEWTFPVDYTRHTLGADPRKTIILEVVGDSMRPTLEPGDRVLVDTSMEWRNDDSVWLIDDGAPKVKRIRLVRGSDPVRIQILSDNPAVTPEEVREGDIRIIGRVCGRVSRM